VTPGSSASLVVWRYDVNVSQVAARRRRYRAGSTEPTALQLMPVMLTPDQPIVPTPERGGTP
jgi:hypothetical protein